MPSSAHVRLNASCDLGQGLAGQHAAGIHGHRDAGVCGAPVTEFAIVVLAPAVGSAGAVQRTRVFAADGDLGEGLSGQNAAGIHGHRDT